MKFDHIGLAVENIQVYFDTVLGPLFNCSMKSEIFTDVLQDSKIAFVATIDGTIIELIEPLSPESPVSAILRNKKGGLHHLCFVADNFQDDIERLKKNKFILVSSAKNAIAFNNRKVAFLLSPSNEVIEIIEPEKGT
jgi:methylmalonyl-CoA/ethylmalonyl-CoA epimerase